MQIILEIPAQPATQNESRQAALFSCFKDGSLLLDARDGKKPARFTLGPTDSFPWDSFVSKLLIAWQLADYSDVPNQFRPQKRIPQFVLEGLDLEPLENKLKVLATLRKQGFFPNLPERK